MDSTSVLYKEEKMNRMQSTMTLESCCRCGQPIAPGEPAMQTASVDIVDGRAVASPVRACHLSGHRYDEYRERERLPKAA